jgi:NAD(P)H-nitrite reductase large subunit
LSSTLSFEVQGVKDGGDVNADVRCAARDRAMQPAVDDDADELERRRLAVIESYKVVCICNKIRRGVIEKAIAGGATSLDEIRRRTRAATGPCGAKRCGPVIAGMLRR